MKKVLNNIGAISKQLIVGGAITVATVMVGIGLMNNFTNSGSSEKGFASNALENSYKPRESSYSGPSAEEILSARDYAQNKRNNTIANITGTERFTANTNGGTQNKANTSAGATNQAQNGAGDVNISGYTTGPIENMGTSNGVRAGSSSVDAATVKAQREAKIKKGEALGNETRATLKKSEIADGSTIKGVDGSSTAMAYNNFGGIGANYAGLSDSSKVALANRRNSTDLNGNTGKLGTMDNNSIAADGKRHGRTPFGQAREVLGDLGTASKYSKSGKEAVVSDSAKGAADAAAAFDGSQGSEPMTLEGSNLQKAAINSLQELGGPELSKLNEDIKLIDDTINEYNEAARKANSRMQIMMMVAGIAFAASLAVILAKAGGPWCYLIAGAICTAGAIVISGFMWGGENSYANCINQMISLSNNNSGIGLPGKGSMWSPWALFALLNGLMAMSFLGAIAGAIGGAAGAAGGTAAAAAEAGAAAGASSGIGVAAGSAVSGIGKSIMEMIIGAKKP